MPKITELIIARRPKLPKMWAITSDDDLVLDAAYRAAELSKAGRRRIAIMVNRVRTAREIFGQLSAAPDATGFDLVLLTGRLRPLDRDELIAKWSPVLRSGSEIDPKRKPVIVVTTQCLEVGADFSFDALITECASLDALRQRFGRLARLGDPADAPGVILIRKGDIAPRKPDRVYGDALPRTWEWLTANDRTTIEMGIDALEPQLPANSAPFCAPQRNAPILLPAYLDLLCQTGPRPVVEPDISLFLHGLPGEEEQPSADVRVLWRNELAEQPELEPDLWEKSVGAMAPLSGESLSLPIWELRATLKGHQSEEDSGDIMAVPAPQDRTPRKNRASAETGEAFVLFRGGKVLGHFVDPEAIRPGDAVILSAKSATFAALVPQASLPPDVYEQVYTVAREVARVRVNVINADDTAGSLNELIETRGNDAFGRLMGQLRQTRAGKAESELISKLARGFGNPRTIEFANGRFLLTGKIKPQPVDIWAAEQEDEDALLVGAGGNHASLVQHTTDVIRDTTHLCESLRCESGIADAASLAAKLHDLGKADPRFQYVLHRRPWRGGGLRAKSDPPRLPPKQAGLLRELAGLPRGFRHEMLSLQIAEAHLAEHDGAISELIRHLIASHHGHARPFAPVVSDSESVAVAVSVGETTVSLSVTDLRLATPHRLDSGVAERFWRLTRRYGWWGLAYLESLIRSADQHASAMAEAGNEI